MLRNGLANRPTETASSVTSPLFVILPLPPPNLNSCVGTVGWQGLSRSLEAEKKWHPKSAEKSHLGPKFFVGGAAFFLGGPGTPWVGPDPGAFKVVWWSGPPGRGGGAENTHVYPAGWGFLEGDFQPGGDPDQVLTRLVWHMQKAVTSWVPPGHHSRRGGGGGEIKNTGGEGVLRASI